MKFLFLCFVVFSNFQAFTQNVNFSNEKKYQDLDSEKTYNVEPQDLNLLITNSEKKYKLVYTFGVWCKPCIKTLPKLLSVAKKYNKDLELYILLSEKEFSKDLIITNEYLNKTYDYDKPLFNISDSYSKRMIKKYNNFIQELLPGHKEFGFSLLLFYNEKNEIIYASNYNMTGDETIELLEKNLNK